MEKLVNTPIVNESAPKRKKKIVTDSPKKGKTKAPLLLMPKPRKAGGSKPEELRRLAGILEQVASIVRRLSVDIEVELLRAKGDR